MSITAIKTKQTEQVVIQIQGKPEPKVFDLNGRTDIERLDRGIGTYDKVIAKWSSVKFLPPSLYGDRLKELNVSDINMLLHTQEHPWLWSLEKIVAHGAKLLGEIPEEKPEGCKLQLLDLRHSLSVDKQKFPKWLQAVTLTDQDEQAKS